MFENTKESLEILKELVSHGATLFPGKEIKKLTAIEKSEFELEKAKLITDTLVEGLKEIWIAGEEGSGDRIVKLVDWYNEHIAVTEPNIIIKENVSKSAIEKRLESIQ